MLGDYLMPGNVLISSSRFFDEKASILPTKFWLIVVSLMTILAACHVSQCLILSTDFLPLHVASYQPVNVSILMPYSTLNRSLVLESIQRWVKVGSPCLRKDSYFRDWHGTTQLIFYVNTEVGSDDYAMMEAAMRTLGGHAACFATVGLIAANLTAQEDIYPAGPSNMFFKVFNDPAVQSTFKGSTHMFWMEHDVHPLRAGWLDALLKEASEGDFWISGSAYLGDGLNEAVAVPDNWNWVGHINGNALYNMRDEIFRDFLRVVMQYEPPSHFWKPFDVSIWRVLHAFPYTWPLYQKFRSKFVYADYIHHWGFKVQSRDMKFSSSRPEVHLVHGAFGSAGNVILRPKPVPPDVVWNDRILKSARLSILIPAFALPIEYCTEAAKSVIRYVPDALEIVIVVSKADAPRYRAHFNNTATHAVRIVTESVTFADNELQEKWVNLNADKYCEGDLVLHLNSDAVLNRELQLRDILWMGKPILEYRRYEAANETLPKQAATSLALGAPVHHDFSLDALHVFPRTLYNMARRRLEAAQMTTLYSFLSDLTAPASAFSDVDYLGAYAFRHAPHAVALAPVDAEERRELALPPPIVLPASCQGRARLIPAEQLPALVESLRSAWSSGLACHTILRVTA